jgi:hypothetical protein
MKRRIGIGVALTAVLLAALLLLAPERSVFSAGPLAAAHGDLACAGCHDAFTSFADDAKCLGCHEDQRMTPPAAFVRARCVSCHAEHRGRDVDLTDVAAARCAACHDPATAHAHAPVQLAEKLAAPPRDCRRCHGNHAEHRLHPEPTLAQVRAHLAAAHRQGHPLYHKDACEKCHRDKGNASAAAAASIPGFFDPHVTHVTTLAIRCTYCHEDVDIADHSGTRFRRTVATARCVQCHEGEYYATLAPGDQP